MKESPERSAQQHHPEPSPAVPAQPQPSSTEEERVWRILEQARQNVKQVAKRELEGEIIGSDVLNLRLRAFPS